MSGAERGHRLKANCLTFLLVGPQEVGGGYEDEAIEGDEEVVERGALLVVLQLLPHAASASLCWCRWASIRNSVHTVLVGFN